MVRSKEGQDNMKSDAFENMTYNYGNNGLLTSGVATASVKPSKRYTNPAELEVLIKALGTMVIQPEFELNPTTFKREQIGSIQQPILMGEQRDKVLNKLVELIGNL